MAEGYSGHSLFKGSTLGKGSMSTRAVLYSYWISKFLTDLVDEIISQGRRNGMKAHHGGRCWKGRWGLNHTITECRLRGLGLIYLAIGSTTDLDQSGKPDDILRRAPWWPWGAMKEAGARFRERGRRVEPNPSFILITWLIITNSRYFIELSMCQALF